MVLATENSYYQKHQQRLAHLYSNQFIILRVQQVCGGFSSISEAYSMAIDKFKLEIGTFLVIKVPARKRFNLKSKLPVKVSLLARILEWVFPGKSSSETGAIGRKHAYRN